MNTDMSFSSSRKNLVAPIIASLNLKKGLLDMLELTDDGLVFRMPIDYEGIPFKCRRCHKHEGIPFYHIWVKTV
jgi:hypothetical protein